MLLFYLPLRRAPSAPPAAAVPGRARADRAASNGSSSSRSTGASRRSSSERSPGTTSTPALIESIHARSGGNAFFARGTARRGRRGRPDRAAADAARRAAGTRRRPRRADAGVPAGRVRGRPARRPGAARGRGGARRDDAVRGAPRERRLARSSSPIRRPGIERYAFRHALLQEAVYDDLLPGERTRLHSAFARTLEAQPGGDASRAAELAYHWYAAHDLPRAFEASVAAGERTRHATRFPEAQRRSTSARSSCGTTSPTPRRGPVATGSTSSPRSPASPASTSRHARCRRSRRRSRLVDETADPVRAGLLNERLGRYAWIAGQGELANAGLSALRCGSRRPSRRARRARGPWLVSPRSSCSAAASRSRASWPRRR